MDKNWTLRPIQVDSDRNDLIWLGRINLRDLFVSFNAVPRHSVSIFFVGIYFET